MEAQQKQGVNHQQHERGAQPGFTRSPESSQARQKVFGASNLK